MTQKPSIRRIYALEESYSGIVGEMAVATALLRAGHRVAKPYWNNDSIDLLVFWRVGLNLFEIPVQVKSIQRLESTSEEIAIQGLRKKYVELQPALCLGIYSPELNKLWFIPGADNIRKVHKAGVAASKTRPGGKRNAYDSLGSDDDVRIYVNLTRGGNQSFDRQWLVDSEYPAKLTNDIKKIAMRYTGDSELRLVIDSIWRLTAINDPSEIQPTVAETGQNG